MKKRVRLSLSSMPRAKQSSAMSYPKTRGLPPRYCLFDALNCGRYSSTVGQQNEQCSILPKVSRLVAGKRTSTVSVQPESSTLPA